MINNRYSEEKVSESFFNDIRKEILNEISLRGESLRDENGSDDFEKDSPSLNKKETDSAISVSLNSYKKIIEEKNKKIEALEKELKSYKAKIDELNDTIANKDEETPKNWKELQTGEVIHLVEYSGIRQGNGTNYQWAAVLHLLTGCSINTLRQKFSKNDVSSGTCDKVEKMYNETLATLKKKNEGKK